MAKKQILIVEDESIVAKDIKNTLEMMGYEVPFIISSGEEAIDKIDEFTPDLILMDIMLKGTITGIEATNRIKAKKDVPIIYLTAYSDEDTIQNIKTTDSYGYILKPFKEAELSTTIEMAIHKHKTEKKNLQDSKDYPSYDTILTGLLKTLSKIVEIKNPFHAGHAEKVSKLSVEIAEQLGLSSESIDAVRIASYLHNIGYLYIPIEILTKPSKLSESEFQMIKAYPRNSYEILKDIDFTYPIADIVLQHHERMDGSGYPQGLSGDDIMMEARIIAVADVVEAMDSKRPYRDRIGVGEALEHISEEKGKLYDPQVADACLKLFKERGFRF
jgi:response regulator RpfG family c-di-GMP phosphodiesterase